jgi:hypothetical protein
LLFTPARAKLASKKLGFNPMVEFKSCSAAAHFFCWQNVVARL